MTFVCRLCLKMTEQYESIDDANVPTNREKISLLLPEVAIDLVDSYVLCLTCTKNLQEMHSFKSNCLETEQVVKRYVEANNYGMRVNLIDVVVNMNLTDVKPIEFVHCDDDYTIVEAKTDEVAVMQEKTVDVVKCEIVNGTDNKGLKCDECKEIFPLRSILQKHQHIHKRKCNVCGKMFTKGFGVKVHMAEVHGCTDKTGKHKCGECDAQFVTENALAKHLKVHSIKIGYVCNVCGKELASPKQLRNHRRNHIDGNALKCDFCDMKFKDKHVLVTHLRCHTGEKPFKCERCGKGFAQSSTLYTHIRDVHIGEKRYACHLCPVKFKYQRSLHLHVAKHTGTLEKKYACEICGKSFLRAHGLKNHMRRHANVKNHLCVVCGKSFVEPAGLKRHVITHTGEKPHECHLCEFRCNQKCNLTTHMKSHERKKSIKEQSWEIMPDEDEIFPKGESYECHICEFRCTQKSNLRIHMKSHGRRK